ncbi:MAG: SAM-dependent methyltransferase [Desulfovibrio sp.]|jgi:SAM-dependent methyltransferase|nr:SAM-dependent methyltransferase [Desulfovibrio sp.]
MAKQWKAQELLGISGAYWAGCALQAAVRLDLFSVLAAGARDEADLARALGCDGRALSMLITALCAQDMLEREGSKVSASPEILRFLAKDSPDYTGFIIRHHAEIMKNWVNLADVVRRGRPWAEQEESAAAGRPDKEAKGSAPDKDGNRGSVFTEDESAREDFLMGMFNVARLQAERVAQALDLSGRRSLIDIGGGPGTYAVYFCLKNPDLRADIFDLSTTGPFARKTAARFGLEARIGFTPGNFNVDPLPGPYDVAWVSQVIHGESEAEAAALLRKAGAALNPGGLLCVQEFTLADDLSGPAHAALFSLNMLVQTPGGRSYTAGEISAMLKGAGAKRVRELPEKLPMDCRIFIGEM